MNRWLAMLIVVKASLVTGWTTNRAFGSWPLGLWLGGGLGLALVLWLIELRRRWRAEQPIRGLGDVFYALTASLGIHARAGCRCQQRRVAWNARWPSRAFLNTELRAARVEKAVAESSLQALRTSSEAFKVRSLAFLSRLHERLVWPASGDHAWYVAGPMEELTELFLEEGVGFRSLSDRAGPSSLADDSPGAELRRQDEAVEPRDYSSRR